MIHEFPGHLPGWHPKHHMLAHPTTLPAREVAKVNAHAAHLPHPDHHFCKGLCRDDPYFIHDTCPVAHVVWFFSSLFVIRIHANCDSL